MTTIRCQFPTFTTPPNMGIQGMRASELTAVVVELVISREVAGHESRDEREAMYAAMFGGEA